jgi:hypothetical protein
MLLHPGECVSALSKDRAAAAKGGDHGAGVKKGRTKMKVIRGVIIPMDWDDQGNVVQIAISSHDEMEYMVEREGKGVELLAFIRKEVEVAGEVKERDDQRVVKVSRYQLL